jgi:hypothetical protein
MGTSTRSKIIYFGWEGGGKKENYFVRSFSGFNRSPCERVNVIMKTLV